MSAWSAGLVHIMDLVSPQGVFYSFDQIVQIYGNCITWYQHIQVMAAIPHSWKQSIFQNPDAPPDMQTDYHRISSKKKISKMVYSKLIDNVTPLDKTLMKWQKRLNLNISSQEFVKTFTFISQTTISTKLRDFQYRFLHHLIVTNFQLKIWKIQNNDLCTFCKAAIENILYIYLLIVST